MHARPAVVRTPSGARIAHTPGGVRRVETVRPGGRVVVANRAGHGYVQRPIVVRGHAFVQRTYYVRGVAYPRYYRTAVYRGIPYHVYAPVRYYSPRFYTWAYSPWGVPVAYNFGWAGNPWYGYYGAYFTPYSAYVGPNYWLTDYLLAASLQEAYQERVDAAAAAAAAYDPAGQVMLTEQVKNLVAGEVQRQLAQASAESRNPGNTLAATDAAPPVLAGTDPHVFVVSTSIVVNGGAEECSLTQGDVLQLDRAPAPDPNSATVQVLASKGQDCRAGAPVFVPVADLQEMQNHMRETLDQGLGELQKKQGQSGLPRLDPALRTETAAPYAADLPPAEPNVAAELTQEAQEVAQQDDQAPPPPTVEPGQTVDEVIAVMGKPLRIADLGAKKTYFYKDMKVIFIDGKVSDIE
jgi:hypothetical protein